MRPAPSAGFRVSRSRDLLQARRQIRSRHAPIGAVDRRHSQSREPHSVRIASASPCRSRGWRADPHDLRQASIRYLTCRRNKIFWISARYLSDACFGLRQRPIGLYASRHVTLSWTSGRGVLSTLHLFRSGCAQVGVHPGAADRRHLILSIPPLEYLASSVFSSYATEVPTAFKGYRRDGYLISAGDQPCSRSSFSAIA